MMKQVLTRDDVAKVMADFNNKGKRATLAMLHASLGNRGSMSTLVRLKAEIEAEAQPVEDSKESLDAFREIWALAMEQGRQKQSSATAECQQTIQALCDENERLDARAMAAEKQAVNLQDEKSRAELDLRRLQTEASDALNRTTTALADALQKLSSSQSAHAEQTAKLQAELDAAVQRAHDVELELARAQAHLELRPLAGQPITNTTKKEKA